MATLLHSEPRRLCSWLWDSHITPNNSKWLQENLTEMDGKVRAMIKIINEDADSFARRAEMYYKKRPELMRLVEHFYRAYRALAERYDHVTGELRLAHRTMPEAFPNLVNSMLRDDHIPSSTSEPPLPVSVSPQLVRRAFFSPSEFEFGLSRKGLKQLVEMFQLGEAMLQEFKSTDEDSTSEQCSCLSSDENQSEDRCAQLENLNQLLRFEANNLIQKIAEKDQELFGNQSEVEELMNRVQAGQFQLVQAEATLGSLQNLHFQSQEEQRAMALELSNGLHMLKNLEHCKQDLELEIQHLRDENQGLNDHKLASPVSEREVENEIFSLKEIKEKLDSKVRRQAEKDDAFEGQAHQLNKQIEDLNKKYKDILQQVESAGIDPKHVKSSIEEMNSRLEEIPFEEKAEKEALLKRLEDMEEKSSILESYLSDVHIELERFKERMKAMQESCDSIDGEKLALVTEKSALVSQLQLITERIQNLLEEGKYRENLMSMLKSENMIQSTVLSAVIRQLSSDGSEIAAQKKVHDHEFILLEEKNVMLQLEKDELLERSRQRDVVLEALQKEHAIIQEEHSNVLEANRCLQDKLSKFEEEKAILAKENSADIAEALSFSFQSAVLMNSLAQKAFEFERIVEEMHCLHEAYSNSENDASELMEKLAVKETENMQLRKLNQQFLSELNERSCDLELWEDVAASYYYDLQTCTVREALFESKVHELSGLCKILEDLSVRRCTEFERMRDKISFMERENIGLETHLAAYVPVIASLENNIASLEQYQVSHTMVHLTGTSKEQELTVNEIHEIHPPNANHRSSSVLDGLSELQSQIQTMSADIKPAATVKEMEELNSVIKLEPLEIVRDAESSWSASGTPEIMDETHTKDILLDHVSDQSSSRYRRRGSGRFHQMPEFAENTGFNVLGVDRQEVSEKVTELNEVANGKRILERLSSDAHELERLNLSVQELESKIKTDKKCNFTKAVEYKRLGGQLQDIEDSIAQLVDVNARLIKTIKDSSSLSSVDSFEQARKRKVTRQARKEAERIGRLQLHVQKIQYLLLKLEDEKNENNKGKSRSLRSRTGVKLSDFLYTHGSRSRKQRKVHICGCDSVDVLDPRI